MRISDWSSGLCSSDLAIWAVFPEASFVNVIRDGRDGAVSAFIRFRSKLRADLTQLHYARAYATGWAERIRAARQAAAGRRYLEVLYEALHADPESAAGRLFEILLAPKIGRASCRDRVLSVRVSPGGPRPLTNQKPKLR